MNFLNDSSILVYALIFVGKLLEVAVSTVRIVLISRGEKGKGSIIAFFEILLWLFVTGTVLTGFQQDPIRIFVFAIAFSIGNFTGSWLEDRLAFGVCSVQVIVPEGDESQHLADKLRENNFAVTTIQGSGKDGERVLMILHLKRKRAPQAVQVIQSCLENAVVVVNDSKVIRGGFMKK